MTAWKPVTPVDLHCTRCGACPDEPCRTSEGRSVPPHTERTNAFDASRTETITLQGEWISPGEFAPFEDGPDTATFPA